MIETTLRDFSGGMWTLPDGTAVPDNALSELINMRLTEKGYPTIRFGSKLYNTTTMSASYRCRGLWVVEDAASNSGAYIYSACGGYLYYSSGNGVFTKLASGGSDIAFTETLEWDGKVFNGKLYLVNGTKPTVTAPISANSVALQVDATTVTILTNAGGNTAWPNSMKYLGVSADRFVACADGTSTVYVTSALTGSSDLAAVWNGTDTLLYIGNEDGEAITGIGDLNDGWVFTKSNNVYRTFVQGAFANWQTVRVRGENSDLGCEWHRSIAPFTHKGRAGIAWLGKRGVAHFDGFRDCTEMSLPIRNEIQALPQTKPTRTLWKIDDRSEWEGGTEGSKLLDTSDGYIKPLPQKTADDWGAGTATGTESATGPADTITLERPTYVRLSHIVDDFQSKRVSSSWTAIYGTYGAPNGYMQLTTPNRSSYDSVTFARINTSFIYRFNSIRTAVSGNTGYWSVKVRPGGVNAIFLTNGPSIDTGNGYIFTMKQGTVEAWVSKAGTATSLGGYDTGSNTVKVITIKLAAAGAWTVYIDGTSRITFTSTTYSTFGNVLLCDAVLANVLLVFDFAQWQMLTYHATLSGFAAAKNTGTYESQVIDLGAAVGSDTAFSLGNLVAQYKTGGGAAITFQTATSDDNATWNEYVDIGSAGENGGSIASELTQGGNPIRYLKWTATFSTSTLPTDNPRLYQVFVGGHYISSKLSIGSTPSDIGQLIVAENVPEGTSTEYFVETATTEAGLDGDDWIQVRPNETLPYTSLFNSSQDWFRFKVQMKMELGTDEKGWERIPSVDSVAFEYYTGSLLGTPCAFNWQGKYHLSVDADGDGKNDTVYVCDERGAWAKDTNLWIAAAARFKGRLLTAGSDQGKVRWTYEGDTDEGRAIDYRFTTRDDNWLGDDPNIARQDKCFRLVYPTLMSNVPVLLGSKTRGGLWKEKFISSTPTMATQRAELDGKNSAQYIRYRLKPGVESFQSPPNWGKQNTAAQMYWHEDKYVYYKATTETTVRRYFKPLPKTYTEEDELGFYVMVNPTTLQADSLSLFGFFNTNQTTNGADFIGIIYKQTASKYAGIELFWTSGVESTTWATTQLTAGSDYYLVFSYNPKTYLCDLRILDSTRRLLNIPPTKKNIGNGYFTVNAFGLLSYPSAAAAYAEWKIKEALPYYEPSRYSGPQTGLKFELEKVQHCYVPLGRVQV